VRADGGECLNVKASSKYSYHCTLERYIYVLIAPASHDENTGTKSVTLAQDPSLEADRSSSSQVILCLLCNPKVPCSVHNSSTLACILRCEGESLNGSKTAVLDVIGFLCVSLGSSTVQFHDSLGADAHVHVHRLVSVVKIVTMHAECTTKEQHSLVLFFFVGKRTQCKGYS
jgi:hypothetical protein